MLHAALACCKAKFLDSNQIRDDQNPKVNEVLNFFTINIKIGRNEEQQVHDPNWTNFSNNLELNLAYILSF